MAIKTLSRFKNRLSTGGARPNLFEARIYFPQTMQQFWDNTTQEDFQFFCKATSMPASSIGVVDVPFRGRILKVAGDRTFEPWSITVINDESFNIRQTFESWGNYINEFANGNGMVQPENYMSNGFIKQLSRTEIGSKAVGGTNDGQSGSNNSSDNVRYTYQVQDIWPSEVGSIDLSFDSSDAIEEFTVTFQVQYMTMINAAGTKQQNDRQTADGDTEGTQTQQ